MAILGKEGSGKHSFVNLLLRLYDRKLDSTSNIQEYFKLYGQSIDTLTPSSIRNRFCLLFSKPKLFNDVIRKIIDPREIYETSMVIKVLHFLGFIELKETVDIGHLILGDNEGGELEGALPDLKSLRHISIDNFGPSTMEFNKLRGFT